MLRLFELLGVRLFYRMMSRLAGERMMPPAGSGELETWPAKSLSDAREGARYFLIANLCRLLVYVLPGLAAVKERAWIPLGTMAILVGFHCACILLEIYKVQLSYLHQARVAGNPIEAQEPEPPKDIRLTRKLYWYFAPKKWETEQLYRWIGVELFKFLVTTYIYNTRLTREERQQGKKPSYVKGTTMQNAVQFVQDTRVAETIHLFALLINVPLFLEGLILGLPSIVWCVLPVLILDTYLVLLQRSHRLRMWPLLERAGGFE